MCTRNGNPLAFERLTVADDFGLNAHGHRSFDDGFGCLRIRVKFHAVAHVKDLVHLLPVRSRTLLNHFEQGRRWKEVVFDNMDVIHEVQHLRLRASGTVHHSPDF